MAEPPVPFSDSPKSPLPFCKKEELPWPGRPSDAFSYSCLYRWFLHVHVCAPGEDSAGTGVHPVEPVDMRDGNSAGDAGAVYIY